MATFEVKDSITVPFGKYGTVDIDLTRMTREVMEWAIINGFKQGLNDTYSGVSKVTHPDPDARKAARKALFDKRLDALYAGKVRAARVAVTGDWVQKQLVAKAIEHIKAMLERNNLAPWKKLPKEKQEALVVKTLAKYESEWRPGLEVELARMNEASVDADELMELGLVGDDETETVSTDDDDESEAEAA